MNIEVKKDVLFAAPEAHRAIEVASINYASRSGNELIAIKRIIHGFGGVHNFRNWHRKSCIIRSTDNGKTWREETPWHEDGNLNAKWTCPLGIFPDPKEDVLIKFFFTSEVPEGVETSRFYGSKKVFSFYQLSSDKGQSWSEKKQIVCKGHTRDKWMPGVEVGVVNATVVGPVIKLSEGSILVGFTVHPLKKPMQVSFLKGFLNSAKDEIEWQGTQILEVPEDVSPVGICEPDLVSTDGIKLISTMRCQGNFERNIPSTRQIAVSEDNGQTWSSPRKLIYDDGTDVFVPASFAGFVKLKNRIFWIANILDHPVCGHLPRYPLTIAEFDPDKLCIIRDSVTIIQDLPTGAPAGDELKILGRRYTNFTHYVDRETEEIVLIMVEMPKIDWDDFTSDCIRFRIKIKN